MKSFKNKLNESFQVNEGKANYSLAYDKIDKFMNDDPDAQDEFYDIEDEDEMAEFLELNIIDDGNFFSYAGKKATYKGFAKYILRNSKNESLNEGKSDLYKTVLKEATTSEQKKYFKEAIKELDLDKNLSKDDLVKVGNWLIDSIGSDAMDMIEHISEITGVELGESLNEGKESFAEWLSDNHYASYDEDEDFIKDAVKAGFTKAKINSFIKWDAKYKSDGGKDYYAELSRKFGTRYEGQ